jgi:hypothetical protein
MLVVLSVREGEVQ